MGLRSTRRAWEIYGREDPLWAVLSVDAKRGGRWDPEEFFQNGREAVAGELTRAQEFGITVPQGPALDFGCGVGRLTQALAEHFAEVHGVDISAPMIEQAVRFNRHGSRCTYHVNDTPDLALFDDATFALVLTMLVLQHIPPRATHKYIQEFSRVLIPGGVAILQIPAGRQGRGGRSSSERLPPKLRSWLVNLRLALTGRPAMQMNPLPEPEARTLLADAGLDVVGTRDFHGDGWRQVIYFAVRRA